MNASTSAPFTSDLAEQLAPGVVDRLVAYARVDTQSSRDAEDTPSTPGQWDLLRLLQGELEELGLAQVELDDHGYLFATLPATVDGAQTIGLLAHVDVSPDAPAAGVQPIVHRAYDGGVIELPCGGTVLDPGKVPGLANAVGHDLVTSSGDTLLGADDKAGMAEIMAAISYLVAHPELPRPALRVGFTPDEEIGRGPILFDVERFGALCAYTLDGSDIGEVQAESFTGSEVVLTIRGVDVHPGSAKGILVNAARLAGEVLAALPAELTPEATEERQGFLHPFEVRADSGTATLGFIARDFEEELLTAHIALLRRTAEEVVARQPDATLEVKVTPQYPNMRDHLAPFPKVVENAEAAIRREGLEPVRSPIRGGTDGSQLSAKGLPTPNIFTGGHEYHSEREWASVQEMAAAAAVVVHLAGVWARPTQ